MPSAFLSARFLYFLHKTKCAILIVYMTLRKKSRHLLVRQRLILIGQAKTYSDWSIII